MASLPPELVRIGRVKCQVFFHLRERLALLPAIHRGANHRYLSDVGWQGLTRRRNRNWNHNIDTALEICRTRCLGVHIT